MLMLGLAVYTLPARVAMLDGDAVRNDFLANRLVTKADMERLHNSRYQALEWRGDMPGSSADLATMTLAIIDQRKKDNTFYPSERLQSLGKAQAHLRDALGNMPIDSYGWAQLSYVALSFGDKSLAKEALELSKAIDPHEYRLVRNRAALAEALQ